MIENAPPHFFFYLYAIILIASILGMLYLFLRPKPRLSDILPPEGLSAGECTALCFLLIFFFLGALGTAFLWPAPIRLPIRSL